MAAADKARYYLEESVPDLQALQKKGIFTQDEITAIVQKRNDFEHTINGPGPSPADFLRYAAYEMNLYALREKRYVRLGVKDQSHTAKRAIFFILDRATKKFPGDKKLWRQYIDFCEKEKANKKLAKVFTSALRMSPRDTAMWIRAAKHYAEEERDMTRARDYMQRGIRFNSDDRKFYLEYVRLELIYLAKLDARRRILGLAQETEVAEQNDTDDLIVLAGGKELAHMDSSNLSRIVDTPFMHGALPIAIFDSAMIKFKQDPLLIEHFLRLSLEFAAIEPVLNFRQHILLALESLPNPESEQFICMALHKVAGLEVQSVQYPIALGEALGELKRGESQLPTVQLPIFLAKAILLILPMLSSLAIDDENISRVLRSSARAFMRRLMTVKHHKSAQQLMRDIENHNAFNVDTAGLSSLCNSLPYG